MILIHISGLKVMRGICKGEDSKLLNTTRVKSLSNAKLIPADLAKQFRVKDFREAKKYENLMTEEEEIRNFYKNSGLV